MVNKVVAELAKAHPHDLLFPGPSFTQYVMGKAEKEKEGNWICGSLVPDGFARGSLTVPALRSKSRFPVEG